MMYSEILKHSKGFEYSKNKNRRKLLSELELCERATKSEKILSKLIFSSLRRDFEFESRYFDYEY